MTVDRTNRVVSLLTLAMVIGLAANEAMVPVHLAVLEMWIVGALAVVQLGRGIIEHARSLKEASAT